MASSGRKEQAERTIFQLMLQQVTSMVVQGLSQGLFYSKNEKFVLMHFEPTLPSYAPRKYQKTFNFLMSISGFKWNIG